MFEGLSGNLVKNLKVAATISRFSRVSHLTTKNNNLVGKVKSLKIMAENEKEDETLETDAASEEESQTTDTDESESSEESEVVDSEDENDSDAKNEDFHKAELERVRKEEQERLGNKLDKEREKRIAAERAKGLSREEAEALVKEGVREAVKSFQRSSIEDRAEQLASSPEEKELILYHYDHSIVPTGNIREDLENAYALANKNKTNARISELQRAVKSKKTRQGASDAGQQVKPKQGPKITSEDVEMAKFAGTTPEEFAKRRIEKEKEA